MARSARAWKVLGFVLTAAVVAGIGLLLWHWITPVVEVTRVVRGPVVRAVYATGTLSPEREYPIRATSAGRLDKVWVDKNSAVRTGDKLAVIDEPAVSFALAQATAELREKESRADAKASPVLAEFDERLRAAREQLEIARREEARQREFVASNSGSVADVDRAADKTQTMVALVGSLQQQRETKRLELLREADVARAAVERAASDVARQTLASPIDGTVLDRPTAQGTRVAINDVVMRVADVRPDVLVMRAAVDEEDVTSVRVGQKVLMSLYAFEGRIFVGRVKTIYSEADPARRTFEVDVSVESPSDRFQPGMTGELAFVLDERPEADVLPSVAVQKNAIYVVRDGKIARLDAKVGVRAVDRVEVLSGIAGDDRVVVSGVSSDDVGKRVRVKEVDPRQAAGLPDAEKPSEAFKAFK